MRWEGYNRFTGGVRVERAAKEKGEGKNLLFIGVTKKKGKRIAMQGQLITKREGMKSDTRGRSLTFENQSGERPAVLFFVLI